MRPAAGYRVYNNANRRTYMLRLDVDDFDLVTSYAAVRGLSFNAAIAALVRAAGLRLVEPPASERAEA